MFFSNIFFLFFAAGLVLRLFMTLLLEYVDWSFRKKHGTEIPEVLNGYIEKSTLEKTCRYEDANMKLHIPQKFLNTFFSAYLVISGFYAVLFNTVFSWTQNLFFCAYLFLILTCIPGFLLSIPFDLYSEFEIEKRFGFSKMTKGLWISDLIKEVIIELLIAAPLLLAATMLFKYAQKFWWILFGTVYFLFSMFISVIYPIFISPIFNKFSPLEDGELKNRLENLLSKCGFKSNGLFVMDASLRSGHSNAYFTGFGKSKRVVLYDTLIEQLEPEEIEAVLAHELGHYKHHHIAKRIFTAVPLVFAVLFAVSMLIKIPALYEAFGFSKFDEIPYQVMIAGLFFVFMTFGNYGVFLDPVVNFFSRKDEYQADAFAKHLCGSGKTLISALIKLNKENLSEIQVPRLLSIFCYSHPPLLERIKALS